jgi:inosine-uridine nucleoside N-ribohydrolase
MVDPEASKIALNAKFPNIIIAGNVANQVISSQEFLDEIYEVGTLSLATFLSTDTPSFR